MQHKVNKPDDKVHSIVEIPHPGSKYATIDIYVPLEFKLGSYVYVTVTDSEPDGGAAEEDQ